MEQKQPDMSGPAVVDWLAVLTVGQAVAHDRLTVFAAFAPAADRPALSYRTLAEALAEGWVEVSERAAATVPELVLTNRGHEMVLVMGGEEIVGGKQNRIVNASFLVGAKSQVTLPVTCVEHGRWHGASPRFRAGEASYHSLRRAQQEQVSASLDAHGRHAADQAAIWADLAVRHARLASHSPTGAMQDLYRHRAASLDGYAQALPYPHDATGLIAAIGDQVAGADLFDSPRTAAALWERLVRSYALDALEPGAQAPVAESAALAFLQRARAASYRVFPSLALGEDVRLQGDGVSGAALVYQGTPVHVALYAASGEGRRQVETPHLARSSLRRWLQSEPPDRND